jgi:hypothetical protein
MKRSRPAAFAALLGAALALLGPFGPTKAAGQYHDARLKVGARPLPLTGGKDLTGKPFSVAGYKGTVLLIDFWATW